MSTPRTHRISSTLVEDRGEAKYFHGRKEILGNFKERLELVSAEKKYGTTILIQAAPGAGKTALLMECARLAREQRWHTAEIDPDELYDPKELSKALSPPLPVNRQKLMTGRSVQVIHRESISEHDLSTTLDILKYGREPLLLMMDEAQLLRTAFSSQSEEFRIAAKCLKAIHNGKLERPVILIAAGLGATTQAFDNLGVSRFKPQCKISLGPLSEEARRAVIKDWLLEEGGAKGDSVPWIHAIVRETYGWPQHIMAYVWPTLKQLKLTDGELTPEGLKTVLEQGRTGRIKFYEARTRGIPEEQLHCIARVIACAPSGTSVAKMDIMASLRMDYNHDTAEKIFTLALHKGILDERNNRYVVPIPSMHNWLVDNFACYRAPLFPPPQPPARSMGFNNQAED